MWLKFHPETFMVINSSHSYCNSTPVSFALKMLVPAADVKVREGGRIECHILIRQCADSSAVDDHDDKN